MTLADQPAPRDLADRIFRESLREPANLSDFLRHALPDLGGRFDCARARLLDRDFPLEDWRRREADLPFEIPYRMEGVEEPALVCLLIEHQSDTDPLIPLRLLYFLTGYWDRQWQAWARLPRPRPPLRLHPVLAVVLYTGATPWGSNRTLADLLGEPAALHPFAPVWGPIFWNLADRTPQELLATGTAWLQTLAVVRAERDPPEDFRAVLEEATLRLGALSERDPVRWHDLLRIILTYTAWRRPEAERDALMAMAARNTPARHEEVQSMSRTIAEAWMEEGRARGQAEGQLLTARSWLRTLLEDRFGPLPDSLVRQIQSTTDLDRLQAAARQVLRLEKLEDLRWEAPPE